LIATGLLTCGFVVPLTPLQAHETKTRSRTPAPPRGSSGGTHLDRHRSPDLWQNHLPGRSHRLSFRPPNCGGRNLLVALDVKSRFLALI
jgi:hypothetical protein